MYKFNTKLFKPSKLFFMVSKNSPRRFRAIFNVVFSSTPELLNTSVANSFIVFSYSATHSK